MIDSSNTQTILDTLYVVSANNILRSIPIEFIIAGSTLLGVIISIIGNFIVSNSLINRQAKVEIKLSFFEQRLKVYQTMTGIIWNGCTDLLPSSPDTKILIPKAYLNPEKLEKWLDEMVQFFENSRLLIDKDTKEKFSYLNLKLVDDLVEIKTLGFNEQNSRLIGGKSRENIRDIVWDLFNTSQSYLNSKYGIDLEIE